MKTRHSNLALVATLASILGLSACDSVEGFLGGSILTAGILGLLALILIIYAVVDLIRRPLPASNKLIWGVVIIIFPFIGALLYLLIGRN